MKSSFWVKGFLLLGALCVLGSCQEVGDTDTAESVVSPQDEVAEVEETESTDKSGEGNGLFDEGVDAYNDNDLETAAEKIEAALEQGVSTYSTDEVLTILGNVYTDLDRFEQAIEQHKLALDFNPENHQAWVNMGVAHRLIGDYDAAEKAYLEALELKPDYPELYASLGALSVVRGNPEQAIEHLEHAAELDSNIPVTFANLALAYAMADRFDEAETSLKRALVLGYENGDVVKSRIEEFRSAVE